MASEEEEDQATRDALQRLEDDGSDMSRPMAMDFVIVAPSREAAKRAAAQTDKLGFDSAVEQSEDGRWVCFCSVDVVPEFAKVRSIEKQLDAIARPLGGRADGFGSYGNADGDAN